MKKILFEVTDQSGRKNEYFYVDEETVELVITRKKQNQKLSILLDNNPNLLKLLQKTFWVYSRKKNKPNSGEFFVSSIGTPSKNIKREIYNFFYKDSKIPKNIYIKRIDYQSLCYDYRVTNLASKIKGIDWYKENLSKLQKNAENTINKKLPETLLKRMGSNYSKKLSEHKKEMGREASVLNFELVEEIRKDFREKGVSQQVLSEMYDVSRTLIADVVNFRVWNQYEISQEDTVVEKNIKEVLLIEYTPKKEFILKPFSVQQVKIGEFVYVFKQSVDEQYYMSKHDLNGRFLSDVHLYFVEPNFRSGYKNFVICNIRGNLHEGYKMTTKEVYNVLWSIHCKFHS